MRTKIIATLGPASNSKEVIKQLMFAGVSIFRLNFSHGSYDQHEALINIIKELRVELKMAVAMMVDLQGPKLRTGEIGEKAPFLATDSIVEITTNKCICTEKTIYINYKPLPQEVKLEELILIDDGKIKLQVIESNGVDKITAKVLHGGVLNARKGLNLPNTKLSVPSLSEKDIADAEFAVKQGVEWLALSFVRSATDVIELKKLVKKSKIHPSIIAKIEKPEAIDELKNIIDLSDAIMIARGDLGVEVEYDIVPILQKKIIHACQKASKPVIVATQMMESMITNFRPTRAEATDVANAVIDGADALMLSGETSVGENPVEVIRSMSRIIKSTEASIYNYYLGHYPEDFSVTFMPETICYNACNMAKTSKAKAIVVFTWSGFTAKQIISHRPEAKVFVFTANNQIVNKLALMWGVHAFSIPEFDNIDKAIETSINELKEKNFIDNDDIIIHVGSTPLNFKSTTNLIKISYV